MGQPLNIKRGGACMYYKTLLVVKMVNISHLQECLLCEVMIDNIRRYFTLIYRSPSQKLQTFSIFYLVLNRYLLVMKAISLTLQCTN